MVTLQHIQCQNPLVPICINSIGACAQKFNESRILMIIWTSSYETMYKYMYELPAYCSSTRIL